MSVPLLRDTAAVLFDARMQADPETREFSGHRYFVHKLVALERLGLVEHAGPDRWRLTELGVTTTISIPENREQRIAAADDDVRDRRGQH